MAQQVFATQVRQPELTPSKNGRTNSKAVLTYTYTVVPTHKHGRVHNRTHCKHTED